MRIIAEEIRKTARVETHRVELTGLGVTETIQEYAQEVDDYVSDLKLKPADRLDFVTFSFGTLVARWWVEQMGGRAHTMISVCAPHHGTTKGSKLQFIPSLQQMQPGSPDIRTLYRSRRRDVRYHSIRLDEDGTLRPPCSSVLDGAANYVLHGKAHMAGPYRQVVRELIRDIYLGKAAPSGPQKLTPEQLVELKLAPGRAAPAGDGGSLPSARRPAENP